MFRASYPLIHDKKLPPRDWLANYYLTYLERDVRQLLNVGDIEAFGRFIRLCYLLRIHSPEQLTPHAARGAVFESRAVSELLKNDHNRGATPDLYFWRDSSGHEIDLLLDQGQELVPIEIKSGQTFAGDYLKGLTYWRSLPDQEHARSALIYGGDESYMRQEIAVISWQHWE